MTDPHDLLAQGETQQVDAKGPMRFEGDHRLELTKDIIAMANTVDGGTIIIGVSENREDGTWSWDGVEPEIARTFDVSKIDDFVKMRVSPAVVVHVEIVQLNEKSFVLPFL